MIVTRDKILAKVQEAFEKHKTRTYTINQPSYSRDITIEIVGYNEENKDLMLIGLLDPKKGIDGFKSKSSFDFIRNFSSLNRYVYISVERIDKAHKDKILGKGNVKRILRKEVLN